MIEQMVQVAPVALASAALFGGISLMTDRPRGAFLAQCALVVGAALVFVSIAMDGPLFGIDPRALSAFAVGIMASSSASMLYHLYLGRFTRVWAARAVFTAVFLVFTAVFGFVILSLI